MSANAQGLRGRSSLRFVANVGVSGCTSLPPIWRLFSHDGQSGLGLLVVSSRLSSMLKCAAGQGRTTLQASDDVDMTASKERQDILNLSDPHYIMAHAVLRTDAVDRVGA